MFQKMELSGSSILKISYFFSSQRKAFPIFWEMETPNIFLIFQAGNFLYFRK